LRLLLILDNLRGHKTPSLVLWLVEPGVLPRYTPLSGSGLNVAESIQRSLGRRAREGQTPDSPAEIMRWLEATARGWNADPTPSSGVGSATSVASAAGCATTRLSAAPALALAARSIADLPPSINGDVHAN
jgi:hypothetical protein